MLALSAPTRGRLRTCISKSWEIAFLSSICVSLRLRLVSDRNGKWDKVIRAQIGCEALGAARQSFSGLQLYEDMVLHDTPLGAVE